MTAPRNLWDFEPSNIINWVARQIVRDFEPFLVDDKFELTFVLEEYGYDNLKIGKLYSRVLSNFGDSPVTIEIRKSDREKECAVGIELLRFGDEGNEQTGITLPREVSFDKCAEILKACEGTYKLPIPIVTVEMVKQPSAPALAPEDITESRNAGRPKDKILRTKFDEALELLKNNPEMTKADAADQVGLDYAQFKRIQREQRR